MTSAEEIVEKAIKETEKAKERRAKIEDLKHKGAEEIVDKVWVEKRRTVARLWKK